MDGRHLLLLLQGTDFEENLIQLEFTDCQAIKALDEVSLPWVRRVGCALRWLQVEDLQRE